MFPFSLFFLFALSALAAPSWQNHSLINACNIFDLKGSLMRSFPGSFCQFLDDGSYISTDRNMRYLNKNNELMWSLNIHFHHQVNLSPDKKRILALASNFIDKEQQKIRSDRFLVIDFSGKILLDQSAEEILQQIKSQHHYSKLELTHFNSFYEIPDLQIKNAPSYLKAGNYILNAYKLGVFILSADLKKVLFHQKFAVSDNHQIHDVQVLPNGNILYFNNLASGGSHEAPFSAIQEMNLASGKIEFEFTATPKQTFMSRHCGGVQILDKEYLLFSHMLTGTYIYSRKTKRIESNIFQTHFVDNRFYPAQQVKAQDLTRFLSFWK